jgi:TolB-like protein
MERQVFGPYAFETRSGTLWRDGSIVPLGGRGGALLAALLAADGGVVTRSDLLDQAWPGAAVEDSNLAVQVATLRKLLGTRPDGEEWIVTVPRVGYRLPRDVSDRPATRPAIAVLPFLNLSSDLEQEHFVDGIVEDLITALSRFRTFAVVARTSSFVYKHHAADVRDVARALGVRYVLEGSIRRAGRQVRVSTQLIDGTTGAHLWAENLDGTFEDVFDFQDRLTSRIVALIEPQIRQAEIDRARRKRPENLDAYDLYLRALYVGQRQRIVRVDEYDEEIRLAEASIALDGNFAPALAYAAWSHEARLTRMGVAPPGVDDAAAAIDLADRALAADPNDAMVLLVAGTITITVKHDFDAGFALVQRALALNPNSAVIVTTAAYFHFHQGDFDGAIACALRALLLVPGGPDAVWTQSGLARFYLSAGRFEDALTWSLRAVASPTAIDFAYCVLAAAYAGLERPADARAALATARSMWPALTVSSLLGAGALPTSRDRFLTQGLLTAGLPAGDIGAV